jgi:hypothetical protein
MQDFALIALLLAGVGLLVLAVASFALHYFIALRAPPSSRAAWTVGTAFLITAAIFTFGGVPGYEIAGTLAAIPGALIAFWFWRGEFRRGWIADPTSLPAGLSIANDDWRVGLVKLIGLLAASAVMVLVRRAIQGS